MKMNKLTLLSGATLLLLGMGGCTPTHKVHGNLLQDYQLEKVVVGEDTQSDILVKLGSPTTVAPFNNNKWYYMGQETEKRGILDPEVKEERIVIVTFEDGKVANIEDMDKNRLDLPVVRRKTPTSGNEMTMMQQLLGNLGRFNKEEAPQ